MQDLHLCLCKLPFTLKILIRHCLARQLYSPLYALVGAGNGLNWPSLGWCIQGWGITQWVRRYVHFWVMHLFNVHPWKCILRILSVWEKVWSIGFHTKIIKIYECLPQAAGNAVISFIQLDKQPSIPNMRDSFKVGTKVIYTKKLIIPSFSFSQLIYCRK